MKKLTLLLIALTLSMWACKKEEVEGPQGPKGEQGPPGEDGNANVTTGTATVSNWSWNSPNYWGTMTWSEITQDIVNTGAIFVYMQVGSSWFQLPYTWYPSSSYSRSYAAIHAVGEVRIRITDSDHGTIPDPGSTNFKVVLIESSNLPEIDFDDYEEVRDYYKIDESNTISITSVNEKY